MKKDFRYYIKIITNQRTVEWATDDPSPANIENVMNFDAWGDSEFVNYGEIVDLTTGEKKTLSDDGHWKFV